MQFSEVIGHTELKMQLIEEVQSAKISHAQLFLGQAGYGSLPLALAFVKYIFCEDKGSSDSCGVCPSCKKVQELKHPDLHFSFPTPQTIAKTANEALQDWRKFVTENAYFSLAQWVQFIDVKERQAIISTHEGDEIIKRLNLKSYEGGFKVMLIWMAETMNTTSANKILKILEEPPPKTLFILIAEDQEKLLQTIISRTQVLRIPRISTDDLSVYLRHQQGVGNAKSDSIASFSDGNLLVALDQLADSKSQDENREWFMQLMRVCYKKDVIPMMDWSDLIADQPKEKQKTFLKYALHMFRQSLLKNYTQDVMTRVSEEEDAFLKNFAKFITGNNIREFAEVFDNAHYYLERNANARLLFTNLCFQVMRLIRAA